MELGNVAIFAEKHERVGKVIGRVHLDEYMFGPQNRRT